MGRMKKLLAVLLIATMAFVMTGCSTEEGGGDDKGGDKKVIGVSLMTLQYEFFQDIKAGIEKAAGMIMKLYLMTRTWIFRHKLTRLRISVPRKSTRLFLHV